MFTIMAGALAVVFVCAFPVAGHSASDRPAAFMRSIASQLVAAARSGSPYTMAGMVRRYGDLPDIGLYSLGGYRKHLPRSRRSAYYDGVARFMGRYLIGQAQQYPVARMEILTPSSRAEWGYEVQSRVTLKNGSIYNLRWLVVPRGKSFKVRDVSILGFWMTPFQKRLFENYISDNGGKVTALLAALGS